MPAWGRAPTPPPMGVAKQDGQATKGFHRTEHGREGGSYVRAPVIRGRKTKVKPHSELVHEK